MKIFPVIHFMHENLLNEQVDLAVECGADGVFLISHRGDDETLISVSGRIKSRYPNYPIGINLLSHNADFAVYEAKENNLDMVWADNMGVNSAVVTEMGTNLSKFAKANHSIELFASVAFKYQAIDPLPSKAAKKAMDLGFIPTTSGEATGKPPELSKIVSMSLATEGNLAIASGMTPENINIYAPHLSHILVSTGVSLDDYSFDKRKLSNFINISKKF